MAHAPNWALALAEGANNFQFFRRVMVIAVFSGYWPDLSQKSLDLVEVNEVETGLKELFCNGTVAPAVDKIVGATSFMFFMENYASVTSTVRSQSSISEELSSDTDVEAVDACDAMKVFQAFCDAHRRDPERILARCMVIWLCRKVFFREEVVSFFGIMNIWVCCWSSVSALMLSFQCFDDEFSVAVTHKEDLQLREEMHAAF